MYSDYDECSEVPNFCEIAHDDETAGGLIPTSITGNCTNTFGGAACPCSTGFVPIDGVDDECAGKKRNYCSRWELVLLLRRIAVIPFGENDKVSQVVPPLLGVRVLSL